MRGITGSIPMNATLEQPSSRHQPHRSEVAEAGNRVTGAIEWLQPITAHVRSEMSSYGNDLIRTGLPTLGTAAYAVEELIRKSPSAGPLGELAAGGAVAVITQRFLKSQPHLSHGLRDLLFTGVEFQAAGAVISSEIFHAARTGNIAIEPFIVLSFFLDEYLARAVHASGGFMSRIPVDVRNITRISTAFASFGAGILGAANLHNAGRPEVAWALGLAGMLNFGEAVLTSADKETLLKRAFVTQTRHMATSARREFIGKIDEYSFAAASTHRTGRGAYHHVYRQIPPLEHRSALWADLSQELTLVVNENPEMTALDTESYLRQALKDTFDTKLTPDGPLTGFDFVQHNLPEPRASGFTPHSDTNVLHMMLQDVSRIRQLALRHAGFWTFPREVDDRVRAFYHHLFAGNPQKAAEAIIDTPVAVAQIKPEVIMPPVSVEQAPPALTENENDWVTFFLSVINDPRVDPNDCIQFRKVIGSNDASTIREWLNHLIDQYPYLIP